jgi:hypothetical protein
MPEGTLITERCGCVLKFIGKGRDWNYPTFYAISLCSDKHSCQLKHRVIGREVWTFYDEFKDLDMEATFGISEEEANAILTEWGLKPNYRA